MIFLTPADLAPFATIDAAKATEMIADAEAMAALAAPCITDLEFQADPSRIAAIKAVLRAALLRWHESGSGAVTQQTAGPFGQTIDTRQTRRGMFWPSEIAQLRDMCAAFTNSTAGNAFELDTMPANAYRRTYEPPFGQPHVSQITGETYLSSELGIVELP